MLPRASLAVAASGQQAGGIKKKKSSQQKATDRSIDQASSASLSMHFSLANRLFSSSSTVRHGHGNDGFETMIQRYPTLHVPSDVYCRYYRGK
jgi:hypothetical protein